MASPNANLKPVVACDIDEVLCDFLGKIVVYHNEKYDTKLKVEDFHTYRFWEIWGGEHQESVVKVHDFFETEHFEAIQPVEGARAVLEKHSEFFDFHCVTSRQHVIDRHTRDWVEKFYPGVFKDIHFGNHFSLESPHPDDKHETKRSKPQMCKAIGAVALIDDSMEYATQCATELSVDGFNMALFGNYPWNQGELPANTVRCHNWHDVDQFLARLRGNMDV